MEKECIFRVSSGSNWYRIYRSYMRSGSTMYEVYCNRRRISGVWLFSNFDEAVDAAVALAKMDILFIKDGDKVL